jgi:hypothetical protein
MRLGDSEKNTQMPRIPESFKSEVKDQSQSSIAPKQFLKQDRKAGFS